MNLLYFATPEGNFGDDLNLWLWDALLPGWRDWPASGTLVGVGTILKRGFLPEGPKLVLGSGVGYGTAPDVSRDGPWDFRAVRGPRTAQALGLPPETAIADGAVMIPTLPEFHGIPRTGPDTGEVVFVPHYKSVPLYDWPAICAKAGIAYQTPSADARDVIRRLAGARAVIAESMHAAIIADAFGTPWRGVSITSGFNHFKWSDWAESLGLEPPRITRFFAPMRRLQQGLRGLRPGGKAVPAAAGPDPDGSGPAASGPARPDSADPAPSGGPPPSRATKLAPLLAAWAVHGLKAEARAPFLLSDRAALARVQDRFRVMLDRVAADYGS
jgi:succinoglycan biosynthesis protein ExoV